MDVRVLLGKKLGEKQEEQGKEVRREDELVDLEPIPEMVGDIIIF